MIIPADRSERQTLYAKIISDCFASRGDRKARYDILRNWYLYGKAATEEPAEYNKLYSHIDLLASFLFSGETTTFVIEVPKTNEVIYDFEIEKAKLITPRVNESWHDTNTDIIFNDCLTWALVYDTMLIKRVPLGKGTFGSYAVEPHAFGVLREDIPTISEQEAMAHEFFMTESELRRAVENFSSEVQADILSCLVTADQAKDASTVPAGVQTIIINSTTPTTGEASGQVNLNSLLMHKFEPVIAEMGIPCYELWVYDDDLKDYRKVTMIKGEKLLHDSERNTFVDGEVPFVKITPNPLYNYFWGRSELMYLIPLQEWINERIPQIKNILAKLAKPPISGMGVQETKMLAMLQVAGGLANFPEPASMTSIQEHYPQSATELFREFDKVEQMFDDMSGLRSILKGGGEPGVRAMGHADMLAKLGSSRAKKKAAILEDAAEKYATLILKSIRDYDPTHFITSKGTDFVVKQLTETAAVKVDAHSSSPIFIEEQKQTAEYLFSIGAYDKEDVVDAMRIQNAGEIKAKIKARELRDAPLAQIHEMVSVAKEEEAVTILAKLKKMFKVKR